VQVPFEGPARFEKDGGSEGLGPGLACRLRCASRSPRTATVSHLQRWIDGGTKSPADVLRRARVKQPRELEPRMKDRRPRSRRITNSVPLETKRFDLEWVVPFEPGLATYAPQAE